MSSRLLASPATQKVHMRLIGRPAYGALLILSAGLFGLSLMVKYNTGTSGCASVYNAEWAAMGAWCAEWYQAIDALGITAATFEAYFVVLRILAALPFVGLSIFLMWRRGNDVHIVLLAGLLLLMGFAGTWFNPFWEWGAAWPDPTQPSPVLPLLAQALSFLLLIGLLLFGLLFPDGRFIPSWSRWLAAVAIPLFAGDTLFNQTPLAWDNWPTPWPTLVPLGFLLAGIAAVVFRYQNRANDVQRQQIKWVTLGVLLVGLTVLLDFAVFNIYPAMTGSYPLTTGEQALWWELGQDTLSYVSLLFLGICFVLAILRRRLYDIDLILNRTLVYGTLTVMVVGIYVSIVAGAGLLFHNENNLVVSLAATGVIAVLFQPLRERLQRGVNRLLYGERDDPAGVLTRLTSRLESTGTGDSLLAVLVETIASSLKLPYVGLWLDEGDGSLALAAESGAQPLHVETLALLHQQEKVGELVVAPRSPGEALSGDDRQFLAAIARLTATTARTIQLTDQVQEARVRTVSAREEERRRLRRDLHDGLGPVLASQGLKLAAARQLIREKPEVAERLLDEVMRQGEATVTEVRRLVYALRPPTLDELGLVEAIREHVDTAGSGADLQIVVIAPDTLPEIPAAIEVAAFRIVQEALNNVIRHARAHRCSITIALDDALHIAIEDDGIGLTANARSGVGLHSMRERALEVGGDCVIENGARQGLAVRVTLPVAK